MGYLALFVGLLTAAILLVYAAGNMQPATLARILRYAGGGLLSVATVFFAVTGRLALAFPAALGALALFRGDIGSLGRLAGSIPGVGGKSAGQSSDVETAWLAMWLDHDSGRMGGRVRRGRFAGAELGRLSPEDLAELRAELEDDAESLRLLDAYLERMHGETASDAGAGAGSGGGDRASHAGPRGGSMSRDEAFEVLGLAAGASADEIRAAHRALMQKVHPDRGGSSYLAAKLNQAKDLLLKD